MLFFFFGFVKMAQFLSFFNRKFGGEIEIQVQDGAIVTSKNIFKDYFHKEENVYTNEHFQKYTVKEIKSILDVISSENLDINTSFETYKQMLEILNDIKFTTKAKINFFKGSINYINDHCNELEEIINRNQSNLRKIFYVLVISKFKMNFEFFELFKEFSFIFSPVNNKTSNELLETTNTLYIDSDNCDYLDESLKKHREFNDLFWFLFDKFILKIVFRLKLSHLLKKKDLLTKLMNSSERHYRFGGFSEFLQTYSSMEPFLQKVKNISFVKLSSGGEEILAKIFSSPFKYVGIDMLTVFNSVGNKINKINPSIEEIKLCENATDLFDIVAFNNLAKNSSLKRFEITYTQDKGNAINSIFTREFCNRLEFIKICVKSGTDSFCSLISSDAFQQSNCEKHIIFRCKANVRFYNLAEKLKNLKVLRIFSDDDRDNSYNSFSCKDLNELIIKFESRDTVDLPINPSILNELKKLNISCSKMQNNFLKAFDECELEELSIDSAKALNYFFGEDKDKNSLLKRVYIYDCFIFRNNLLSIFNRENLREVYFMNCTFDKSENISLCLKRNIFIKVVLFKCKKTELLVKNIKHLPITIAEIN